MPLVAEELPFDGRCDGCYERYSESQAKANNDILTHQRRIQGAFAQLQAPGLSALFGGIQSAQQAQLAQQQQQLNMEQQRRLMEQQMNMAHDAQRHDYLRHLLGSGIHPPDKQ